MKPWASTVVLFLVVSYLGTEIGVFHTYPNRQRGPSLALRVSVAPGGRGEEHSRDKPKVHFEQVARSSGIGFEHFDPVTDTQYVSETIGSGAGWIDFDGDGYLDLVLINSAPMPGAAGTPEKPPLNRFYRNCRDGNFEDVSDHVWANMPGFGQGVAVGDFDNDGFEDRKSVV